MAGGWEKTPITYSQNILALLPTPHFHAGQFDSPHRGGKKHRRGSPKLLNSELMEELLLYLPFLYFGGAGQWRGSMGVRADLLLECTSIFLGEKGNVNKWL